MQLGKPFGELVISLVGLMTLSIGLRLLIGWLYNVTAGSILLVAIVHVTFNATNNNNLLTAAAPGNSALEYVPWVVIAVMGLLVAVLTRGRLGAPAPPLPERAAAERAAEDRAAVRPVIGERRVGERMVGEPPS